MIDDDLMDDVVIDMKNLECRYVSTDFSYFFYFD